MSKDTIYRQDAIDAVCIEWCGVKHQDCKHTEDDDYWCDGCETVLRTLPDLPSAQSEIIRCGQCKYAEVADKEDAQDGYTCQFHRGSIWFSGSYCSWGERKSDEQV